MKVSTFSVSNKEGEVLNWSFGLFLAISVLRLIDHWTGAPNEGQGVLTLAFATAQSTTAVQIAESFFLALTELAMFEVFRRCVNRNNHFFIHLSVIVMMVLTSLISLCSLLPRIIYGSEERITSRFNGGAAAVFDGLVNSCTTVFFFVEIFLSFLLIRKFAGKLRLYGASLIGCRVLTALLSLVYLCIYTYVGGVTMTEITTYGIIVTVIGFLLGLVPFWMLRKTMVAED